MVWMDVCEAEKALQRHTAVETSRRPLVPAEKCNGVSRRPKTREVSSRYKSPTPPSTPSGPKRCSSPNLTRTAPMPAQSAQKRALSAERKRPSTPPSPPGPSTPARDLNVDTHSLSRRMMSGRVNESLWPSTMRSLSVSFQSDAFSLPIGKREKPPVTHAAHDRTLKPSSNVAHKQTEMTAGSRKPTPERKRSPLKGKNGSDQLENSNPVEGIHARLIDQHRWPSRTGGRISSHSHSKSMDLSDKTFKTLPSSGIGVSLLRRMPMSDAVNNPLSRSASDAARQLLSIDESGRAGSEATSVDDIPLRVPEQHKPVSLSLSERMAGTNLSVRTHSLPSPGSRPASPNKISALSSSISRGVGSPSRARSSTPTRSSIPTRPSTPTSSSIPTRPSTPSRPSTPTSSRSITSPSRIRPSSPQQSNSSTSVLSFIADFRKGKKGASHIEDAHQLRLLYNRNLQWRFVSARAEDALYIQKETAEKTLNYVWSTTLEMWVSVIAKRIKLQQVRLELKLKSILKHQMAYLDEWALIEREHSNSLSGVIEDLEASTLRLPVTGGARADIETVKLAICSAVDVMQAMGSSICALLSRVEEMNCLVSELADIASQERAKLDECEALLDSTAAMQVEEYSLRTHVIQLKQALEEGESRILAMKMPP